MNLNNILRGVLNYKKKINIKRLPSQGLFYNDDFQLSIKKAEIEDILEYENKYVKDDFSVIIEQLKNIVRKNCIFSNEYEFNDLKSIDIIFLFIEIVKYTKGRPIDLTYFNDESGKDDIIEFSSDYFNYFELDNLMSNYDRESKQFIIDDFKFSLPSIGIENSITNFLFSKINDKEIEEYNYYSYDFMFFLGNKKNITFNEIENLIHIFNFDIDDKTKKKIKKIIKMFLPFQKYSLKKGNKIIDIDSKINLEIIWK